MTGFIYTDKFLDHDTGPGHPERPDRLRSIVDHLRKTGLWDEFRHLSFGRAPEEQILRVHSPEHLAFVRSSILAGSTVLDEGDTHVSRGSLDASLLAAGGVLAATDAVIAGTADNAFCAVRPPGHHAESNKVMGFCLFNNVAIAARYAQDMHGIGRVAILDWDVHHGNGTQAIFYDDPSVLYISLHQYPFYPGTGSNEERGSGEGLGATLNVPLPAGTREAEYLSAFRERILPALDGFRPELLLISAGFDAHQLDPLGGMKLTERSFALMTEIAMESARKHARGRIVSVLEGGYDLGALALSVGSHLQALNQR